MATREQLLGFLTYLQQQLDADVIKQEEMTLLQQYYMKHHLLETRMQPADDDWDYISLGIFLKHALHPSHSGENEHGEKSYAKLMMDDLEDQNEFLLVGEASSVNQP